MLLLKILDKLGRKKIVMDRGPSHPEYFLTKPWTARYYLLFRKRPRWFPFNILIHHILDNDHGSGLHNHPFPYITIILKGDLGEVLKCIPAPPGPQVLPWPPQVTFLIKHI